MYKIEKIWGNLEFEIRGTKEVEIENHDKDSETYVKAGFLLDGIMATVEVLSSNYVLLKDARKLVEELKYSILNDRFYQFDSSDIRVYIVPSMYELDINTPDGKADVYKSEYGEVKPYIVLAVRLDCDNEYDELYPDNKFIPNMQVELEHNESIRLVEYISKKIDEILRIRIN